MKYQKFLAKYIKIPGIKFIDRLNERAAIYKTCSWTSDPDHLLVLKDEKLSEAVAKAEEDFRARISPAEGIFYYRYHPDKLPDLIPDTGDMAMHQGLALATSVLMNDRELSFHLFEGSLWFIQKGYLKRGVNNYNPPTLDMLAGLLFGWTMFIKKYFGSETSFTLTHLREKESGIMESGIILNFLKNFYKNKCRLRDWKGNTAKGMVRYDSPSPLIGRDASVMLAAAAFMECLEGSESEKAYSSILEDYGLSLLAEYGHIHFMNWIAWYSLNINMLSLATIFMLTYDYHAYMGMKRILKITRGWNIPFFELLFCYVTDQKIKNKKNIEDGLLGYIYPMNLNQKDRDKKFLWWKWHETPISPRAQINSDWFPQRGNHERYNNYDPDLWLPPYNICYARHDLIFQYRLWKLLKGGEK